MSGFAIAGMVILIIAALVCLGILVGTFFARELRGFKQLVAAYYMLVYRMRRLAPHEMHPELMYWKAGDKLVSEKAHFNENSSKWVDQDYFFKGFLENSFVVQKVDGYQREKEMIELKPWYVVFFENTTAQDRIKTFNRESIEMRLRSSEYNKFVKELQDTQREAFEQFKLTEGAD